MPRRACSAPTATSRQDSHGNGLIYGEVANAIEIGCKDCHGTADAYPTCSPPARPRRPRGNNLALLRNPDGQRRFEWMRRASDGRARADPALDRRSRTSNGEVSLVKDSVDPRASPRFNAKAGARQADVAQRRRDRPLRVRPRRAPTASSPTPTTRWPASPATSRWTTSCGGCHLPIEANWKTASHKYEGEETRNFATYNPQVARDDMFQLGRHQTTKGNIIAPVRSTSALVLSSTNINRERIYVQQPPISARGLLEPGVRAALPAHGAHDRDQDLHATATSREANDNNAIMAQLLLLGTNFVNFVGLHAWVGLEGGFEAVRVTEWDEPQAVIGSYLHRYAYPDFYRAACRAQRPRADQLDPRQDLRRAGSRGETRQRRAVRQHRPGHARPGRLPADARRIYVRRRGQGRLPRL